MEFCVKNKGQVNSIIVWKIDRLSRNMEDHYYLNNFFKQLNIDILSATEPNDKTPYGICIRGMMGILSELENNIKTEQVTAGM